MALAGADRSLERNEHMLAALSSLRFSPMDNGMIRLSGQLDPEAGAVLTATLDPCPHPTRAMPTAAVTHARPTGAEPKP